MKKIIVSVAIIVLTLAGVICGWYIISGQAPMKFQLHAGEESKTLYQVIFGK